MISIVFTECVMERGGCMTDLIFDHRGQIEDRRSWDRVRAFPIKDRKGVIVYEDRRLSAERRGYQLEEITFKAEGIKSLFQ